MSSCPSGSLARLWSTAISMATREGSSPLVALRGWVVVAWVTRDCTSATRGRVPSRVTVMQVPGVFCVVWDRNSFVGSGRLMIPCSVRSKQPISSVGP